MAPSDSCVCSIPLDQLQDAEDLCFEALHMDREMVMDQFDDIFEDATERCNGTLECQGMYKSFPISAIEGNEVQVGDVSFVSEAFANALRYADELVIYAVTVHGYEELVKNPDNDPFDNMFFDAWGVAYAMSSHRWIKAAILEQASAKGRHVGRGWVPGEGELEMSLQRDLFDLLGPSAIGISLPESGLMHPMMSISGFMGVSDNPEIEGIGKDIISQH